MTTPIPEQAAELKVEPVDVTSIDTPLGEVRFLRVKVPLVSARKSYDLTCRMNDIEVDPTHRASLSPETRWACLTYAHLLRDKAEGDEEPKALVATFVGTHDPERAKRPPPTDDPSVMRRLFRQLGEVLANELCASQKLAPIHEHRVGDRAAPEDDIFEAKEAKEARFLRMNDLLHRIDDDLDAVACKVADYVAEHGRLPQHRIAVETGGGGVLKMDLSDLDSTR